MMGCAKVVVNTWKMFLQTQRAVATSCSEVCLSSPSYLNVWSSSGSSGLCSSFLEVTYIIIIFTLCWEGGILSEANTGI